MENIQPPAVAGLFYPASPDVLSDMIEQDLEQATPVVSGVSAPNTSRSLYLFWSILF